MKKRHILEILGLVVCVLVLSVLSCANTPGSVGSSGGGSGKIIHIKGAEHFKAEVLDYEGSVLVDFTAHWCPPCRRLAPHIDRLAVEYRDMLKVVKVYEDEPGNVNKQLVRQHRIMGFPTLAIYRMGSEASKKVGYMSYTQLKSWAEDNM
jgi:thioredoxin 1